MKWKSSKERRQETNAGESLVLLHGLQWAFLAFTKWRAHVSFSSLLIEPSIAFILLTILRIDHGVSYCNKCFRRMERLIERSCAIDSETPP